MNKKEGIFLVLLTALISGTSIFINKFAVAETDSSLFTFLKNFLVAVFLFSLILFTKELKSIKSLTKKQWIKLSLIGIIGGSIPFLLFFKGLSLTTAASGSFFYRTLFIFASIFAFIFLKEKLDKKLIFAAALLLIGNFLLLKLTKFTFGLGELLILIAVLFWALENVLSKSILKNLSGNIVAFGRMFFGSLFILVFLLITNKISLINTISFGNVMWILISSSFLFFFVITYYNGLKHIKVSLATSILLLGSPITTLLSYKFLDVKFVLNDLIGIVLIIMGVVMSMVLIEGSKQINSQKHIHNEL